MSTFFEVVQRQYFGTEELNEPQKKELRTALLRHNQLVFGMSDLPKAGRWQLDDPRVWDVLIEEHQKRHELIADNLESIAATVREHKSAIVSIVSRVLKGHKVASIANGVYEAILSGQHTFLYGTAGVGKTTLVKLLCDALGIPWCRIDGQSDMADVHLLGGFLPVAGQLRWTPGPLVEAGNVVLLIDELPRIPSSVSNILLQPMAERSMAFADLIAGGARQVDLSPAFTVIGTGNPFHYGGMAQKNEAVFDRFGMGFDMPHPENASRLEMLQRMDHNGAATDGDSESLPELRFTLNEEEQALSLLDIRHAAKLVTISDKDKKQIINISEMVSPPEYRRRVGWFSDRAARENGEEYDSRIVSRGVGQVQGQSESACEKHLKQFLQKYDRFLTTVVQEGSNPRGEEMMADVARISALSNGRTTVSSEDLRVAASRCLRFRLKPFPGQEEHISEVIRIASAYYTRDSSIYSDNDRSLSGQTRRDLGLSLSGKDLKMVGAIFAGNSNESLGS